MAMVSHVSLGLSSLDMKLSKGIQVLVLAVTSLIYKPEMVPVPVRLLSP